ncbi:MAG: diaminopimelate epimerase, partial [Pseudomonadota bacterium]|nr:diaminopimelate epimerase [Pseudomonadota bacterium]
MTTTADLPFTKMHGLGNDFIVLDGRDGRAMPDQARMRLLADRRLGLG